MKVGMNFESVIAMAIASIVVGVLGGFATRNIWIGVGLAVVLLLFGVMWLFLRPLESPKEEEKKEDTTKPEKE